MKRQRGLISWFQLLWFCFLFPIFLACWGLVTNIPQASPQEHHMLQAFETFLTAEHPSTNGHLPAPWMTPSYLPGDCEQALAWATQRNSPSSRELQPQFPQNIQTQLEEGASISHLPFCGYSPSALGCCWISINIFILTLLFYSLKFLYIIFPPLNYSMDSVS